MRRVLYCLLIAVCTFSLLVTPPPVDARDTLAPLTIEPEPFEVSPESLFTKARRDEIARLVRENRLFGVPLAVRVYTWPTNHPDLRRYRDLGEAMPAPDKVQEMATNLVSLQSIESSAGARDGILLLVLVPTDHTKSQAALGTGINALPVNNLTQSNARAVLNGTITPALRKGQVSEGLMNGVEQMSYNNLFAKPEVKPLSKLHSSLQRVAGIPLAIATSLCAIALLVFTWWIRQRNADRMFLEDLRIALTPSEASALMLGRANDAVVAGALFEMVRRGILQPGKRWTIAPHADFSDPFLANLHATLVHEASESGEIPPGVIDRIFDVTRGPRESLENGLASRGLFNRTAKPEMMWLLLASGVVTAIALFSMLPSIMGTARFGIFALTLAAIAVIVALCYGLLRPWTTPAGRAMLAFWLSQASSDELKQYESTVHQDDMLTSTGTWSTPEPVRLMRTLRGFSAN